MGGERLCQNNHTSYHHSISCPKYKCVSEYVFNMSQHSYSHHLSHPIFAYILSSSIIFFRHLLSSFIIYYLLLSSSVYYCFLPSGSTSFTTSPVAAFTPVHFASSIAASSFASASFFSFSRSFLIRARSFFRSA